jgi:hypothetical protein
MPSLPEQVDEFGWTLVSAIRDFRSHVEDIFAEHYQAMRRAEDVHNLKLARLSAENGQLRERLGLNPGHNQVNQLWQNIQFQSTVPIVQEQTKKKGKSTEQELMATIGSGFKVDKNKDKDPPLTAKQVKFGVKPDAEELGRRKGAEVGQEYGGGNWETFVCWVPAGSALMCAQPWKPLPNEAFNVPDTEPKVVEEDDDDFDGKQWKVCEIWDEEPDVLIELRRAAADFERTAKDKSKKGEKEERPTLASQDSEDFSPTVEPDTMPFMLHPHSPKRILWDSSSMVMVLYDMIMIPMAFFDLTEGTFIDVMSWMTRMFWTLDMPMSIVTGIVMPNGTILFDLKFIVKRYMKTWFTIDIFIVGSDWFEFIMAGGEGGGGIGNMARIFRIVRTVRLLRLLRMQTVMQAITERIQSDKLYFMLKVVKLAVAIICYSHMMACIWWGIGRSGGNSWSEEWQTDEYNIEGRYLISLHWTLSQFSGGMTEVNPKTPMERFFVVMVWIVAFMGAAIVASILTSSLVQAHIIGGSQARQLSTLRKYLKQNSISKNLSLRVQRSAKHAISGDLSPDAVDLLAVVSEQLRLEMHFEMYSEVYRYHPFFEQCMAVCATVMRRLCHLATSTLLLDPGDVLFSKGEAPAEPKMFFFFSGTLEYTTAAGDVVVLGARQWIAEPVLWLQWVHRGQLKAITDVKVAKLDGRRFQDIMERFKEVFPTGFSLKVYAHDFAQTLNEMSNPEAVNDLCGIFTP